MVLEATVVLLDNSEFMRNCDYNGQDRMQAIKESANLLASAKTQQNPENAVGVMTMADDRITVRHTPSVDLGGILGSINQVQVNGVCDFVRGIQVAQLALKHRQNKNQRQRIVAFVGSPIINEVKELERLGKNLKKNNVSIDIVSIGTYEIEHNHEKIDKLYNAANSNDTSHVLEVPAGTMMLSNVVLSSPILHPEGAPAAAADGAGGFDFGMDPNEDPELAMALRISMEEERARQQQAGGGDEGGEGGAPATGGDVEMTNAGAGGFDMGDDMDDELRQALAMSLAETHPAAASDEPQEKKQKTEDTSAVLETQNNDVDPCEDDEFMRELIGELGADVDADEVVKEMNKDKNKDKDDNLD